MNHTPRSPRAPARLHCARVEEELDVWQGQGHEGLVGADAEAGRHAQRRVGDPAAEHADVAGPEQGELGCGAQRLTRHNLSLSGPDRTPKDDDARSLSHRATPTLWALYMRR